MIKTLVCQKCSHSMRIDYDKAPSAVFTIACPKCSQKYKLQKPEMSTKKVEAKPENKKVENSNQTKVIPCPTCKTQLKLDFSRIAKFPAIVACKSCNTKIKLNDPNLASNKQISTEAKQAKIGIDKSAIDPKNNWAYSLYYYTRRISYVNKVTLMIYLTYLLRSIAKSLSKTSIQTIDAQSFLKLKAESNAISVNTANSVLNPILVENNISPRLLSWAISWFVKKLSTRIVLNILNAKKVDMELPFIKKYLDEVKAENNKLIRILTSDYACALGIILLNFWCNQKINSFSSLSDMLIGLLFFVGIPYLLAKKANFKFVQHLLLSFALVYVLLTLLSFLNISTYRDAIVGVAKSFFAITLLALVYEFVAKKKADAIPQKVHAIIEKLDFKKISIILVVIVVLACVKVLVSTSMAQSSQQETTQVSEDTTATESTTASETQPQVQEQAPIETTPEVEAAAPVQEEAKQLYVINDPDGYTNMRATPGGKIIRKVYKNETFEIITPGDTHSEVKLADGTTGFIHNSRIAEAN